MEKQQCEQFLEYVMDIARQMVECGAEARRVENTALRLVEAYGFELRCANAINSMVEVSVRAPDGTHYTQASRVLVTGTDLGKLERLNALARKICSQRPTVEEIGALLQTEAQIVYSPWLELAGYMTVTGGMAVFFGGTVWDGIASALVAMVIFCLNRLLNHWIQANQNRLFYTFIASFLSGLLAILLVRLGLGQHADKIMIGDVMLFIPGLNLVNGVRELFYRDIITGLYRLIEAIILAVAIAAGFAVAILLFGSVENGGSSVSPALQVLTGAVGACGFALCSHVSCRHLLPASLGGVLSWAIYLWVYGYGESLFLASFVAAAAVYVWSEVMAHGLKAPVTIFLAPGIIPLLPGSFLYYTMLALLNQQSDEFQLQGVKTILATMGIACGVVIASILVTYLLQTAAHIKRKGT